MAFPTLEGPRSCRAWPRRSATLEIVAGVKNAQGEWKSIGFAKRHFACDEQTPPFRPSRRRSARRRNLEKGARSFTTAPFWTAPCFRCARGRRRECAAPRRRENRERRLSNRKSMHFVRAESRERRAGERRRTPRTTVEKRDGQNTPRKCASVVRRALAATNASIVFGQASIWI